ncbi:prohibitin family protein [Massilimicrobiota timonensis]|uniref:Band 7 domain-containing protein n=1 Tax=Massilimicrobiota timonensis TaxID=1776392 RepID=A0A1Y4SQB0_9FIRM|nr:prohibitin family protein [Massilimicrobiota timonensis]OUQ32067.1 hypothetical protein B5E75_12705 [Massilimicrobiota timonensis]
MTGIIIFILKAVLFLLIPISFIGFGIKKVDYDFTFKLNKKCLFSLIPLAVFILSSAVVIIPANSVGVRYSALNGTSKKTLDEGVHLIVPFVDKIYEIDTTTQERTDENLSVQTKDAQWISVETNVKYRVSEENAFKVYKGYKTLDNLNKNIIGNYAQDALNTVCSQYNVIDILGEKRNEIIEKTVALLSEKFENEGITLTALTLKDIDAGDEIEKAIKEEAVAKKQVETAEQNRLKAEKEAETKLIEAQGEAAANAAKTSQLTDEILMEQFIKKWNGELPKVTGSDGNIIDINGILGGN